jgi:hypothetical protein
MRLDRSLGDVQILSDFRVVTPLKQQIDDLPFPGSHVAEVLFHKNHTSPMRPDRASGCAFRSSAHLDSDLCVSICIHTAKSDCGC